MLQDIYHSVVCGSKKKKVIIVPITYLIQG
jgi:hypothetical protein